MGDASLRVELDSSVSPIGSGREVVTCLAVSFAHPHLFIALADGHCMRWSFAASCDASSTITVENTADLVFTKCSDVRMGHIHSMHASPYGSSLIMTRSAQPPTHTTFLRLPKAIYIHRCNTDTVIFPVAVAAQTAFFIIPWNGSAALELYQTCSRTSTYWRDSLLAIWSLVCQTSLSLEQSFRGLQARPPRTSRITPPAANRSTDSSFLLFLLIRSCSCCSPAALPLCSPSTEPSCASEGQTFTPFPLHDLPFSRTRSLRSYTRRSSHTHSLSLPQRAVPPCSCHCRLRPRHLACSFVSIRSFVFVLYVFEPSSHVQLHCDELFEPARVLAVKLTKVGLCIVRWMLRRAACI